MATGVRDGQPGTPIVPRATGRRAEILGQATSVIAAKGILGASISDIATAAGILSGSLYHHFSSKNQILLEILHPPAARQLRRYQAVIDQEEAGGATADQVLRSLIELSVHDVAADTDIAIILHNDHHLFGQIEELAPVEQIRRAALGLWTDVVARGGDRRQLQFGLEPFEVVTMLFDVILGTVRWFTTSSPADPDDMAPRIADLLLAGLRADGD